MTAPELFSLWFSNVFSHKDLNLVFYCRKEDNLILLKKLYFDESGITPMIEGKSDNTSITNWTYLGIF